MSYQSVLFERRPTTSQAGGVVRINPRYVAMTAPYRVPGDQVTDTRITLASGAEVIVLSPPSTVDKLLKGGQ